MLSDFPSTSAGIDKLNAYFLEPVHLLQIEEKVRPLGWELKRVRLKKRLFVKIGREKCFFLLYTNTQDFITGFASNPNHFENWPSYLAAIENVFPAQAIQSAKISRLDLNLDFSIPFETLIQKIDIKNKSTNARYDDKGGHRTGMYVGKAPASIALYDKSRKEKLASPLARIELRLSGKKLPCSSIYEITNQIYNKNFFSELEGADLTFKEHCLNENQKSKIQEYKSILKRDGLFSARKTMNKTRNFDRDFAKLVQSTLWPTQPTELFKREIKSFLGVTN